MKVKKVGTKLIKPLTPTPPNLKNYSISFLDQHVGTMNAAVILFYQSQPQDRRHLEESLAATLVQFYPLAGRYIKTDHFVDCSDHGVEFIVAEALDDVVVANIGNEQLDALLPDQYFRTDEEASDPLLAIQVTNFPCGGLAITISVSHRVFDGSSLATFVAAWSNATGSPDKFVGFRPSFDLPKLLPIKLHNFGIPLNQFTAEEEIKIVVKRFMFDGEALMSLRSRISSNINEKTTSKVPIVSAFIAKTLIGLDRAKHGGYRDFVILQPVNMRERTIPPQSKNACGNLFIPSLTRRVPASEAEGYGMKQLIDLMGDAVDRTITDHAGILSPNTDGRDVIINTYENLHKEMWMNHETNVVVLGDWSKFGFYESDFGWGKPVWTGVGPRKAVFSSTMFMNNKEGDGIEAWLHLNQNDVPYFEQDEEIKLYAA